MRKTYQTLLVIFELLAGFFLFLFICSILFKNVDTYVGLIPFFLFLVLCIIFSVLKENEKRKMPTFIVNEKLVIYRQYKTYTEIPYQNITKMHYEKCGNLTLITEKNTYSVTHLERAYEKATRIREKLLLLKKMNEEDKDIIEKKQLESKDSFSEDINEEFKW